MAELAVAAATYLEQIPPGVPEDSFYALFVMLGFLPPVCGKLFSTVTLTCSHCLATCTAPCPFFNTHVTWTMTDWVDFATALAEATMHPWVQSQGWHAEGCNMSQHLIDLKTMTSWVLLQLQPEHHDKYPFVCSLNHKRQDSSLPHWPAAARWWHSRLKLMGPHKEKTELLLFPNSESTGLHHVHPTWAGTFVLAALVAMFPGINFILLDSDCLPVTLFEVEDLWTEAYLARFPA